MAQARRVTFADLDGPAPLSDQKLRVLGMMIEQMPSPFGKGEDGYENEETINHIETYIDGCTLGRTWSYWGDYSAGLDFVPAGAFEGEIGQVKLFLEVDHWPNAIKVDACIIQPEGWCGEKYVSRNYVRFADIYRELKAMWAHLQPFEFEHEDD